MVAQSGTEYHDDIRSYYYLVSLLITSPLFASSVGCRLRPRPLECKNEYLVFALKKENAQNLVVSSIVWTVRGLKNEGAEK